MCNDTSALKRCKDCQQHLPLDHFSKNKYSADKLHYRCKACAKIRKSEWDARPETQDHVRAYGKQYNQKPEVKERHRAYELARYHRPDVKPYILERVRQYNQRPEQQEAVRLRSARRRQDPIYRECRKVWNANRRHMKRKAGKFSFSEWLHCLDYWQHACAFCGRSFANLPTGCTSSVEHWIPISKGGRNEAHNIIPLCNGSGCCNTKKNALSGEVFLQRKFPTDAAEILARIEAYFRWIIDNP